MDGTESIAGKSFVVTGGCGFIGSHLTERLKKAGAQEVRVLDCQEFSPTSAIRNFPPDVEIIRFKLGHDDPGKLPAVLRGTDYVFHLAAIKHQQSEQDPLAVFRTNIEGTYSLLEACRHAGVKKVIFSSSLYAYGRPTGRPFEEDHSLFPDTVYGISKAAGESLHHFAQKQWGLNYSILRLFFIYGPGQYQGFGYKSVIVKNFEKILRGESPEIFGDGMQALDYVYIDDAVDAFCQVLAPTSTGYIYNVASGQGTKIRDLIHEMIRVSEFTGRAVFLPPDWTAGSCRTGSYQKIAKELRWNPKISLKEGLRLTYEWMKMSRQ